MWKTLSGWLLAFLNLAREVEENRGRIRKLEERLRDLEEAVRLLAQEQRHARDWESSQREKLLLQLERDLTKFRALLPPGGNK